MENTYNEVPAIITIRNTSKETKVVQLYLDSIQVILYPMDGIKVRAENSKQHIYYDSLAGDGIEITAIQADATRCPGVVVEYDMFASPVSVKLTCTEGSAKIYYTTDPTVADEHIVEKGTEYSSEVKLEGAFTLRAVAVSETFDAPSNVTTISLNIEGNKATLTDNLTSEGRIAATSPVVLDLGGKTLKFTENVDTTGLIVSDGGTLTLQNGNIEAEPYVADVVKGGKLIIRSGNYSSNSASVIQVESGECSIYGGTFRISQKAKELYGTKYLLNVIDSKRAEAKITVYGGTFFDFNPETDNSEEVKVADGYKSVEIARNVYQVVAK